MKREVVDMFLLAFGLVVVTLPLVKRLAKKIKFFDYPTGRKQHKLPIPMLGSVSIFFGYMVCEWLFLPDSMHRKAIFWLSLILLCIGLYDDYQKTLKKEFSAAKKGLLQLIVAMMTYVVGVKFDSFAFPFTNKLVIFSPLVSFLLTVLWIFGLMTAINFCDGIDGVAATIVFIAAMTFFIILVIQGNTTESLKALILAGCCLGYFMFNKFPATIFMGDSGASFLGYMLAVISLDGMLKQATLTTVTIPIVCLGIPIFDNLFVIIQRIIENKPVYIGDRKQLHYRALDKGMSVVEVWQYITIICMLLSFITIILIWVDSVLIIANAVH